MSFTTDKIILFTNCEFVREIQ